MDNSPQQESAPQRLETGLPPLLEMNRQQVIESIKNNGVEASVELMGRWCDKAEKWIDEDSLNRNQVTRRLVIVDFAKVDFYLAAGNIEDALDCLDSASRVAQEEGHLDLQKSIEDRMTEVIANKKKD